ncbi:MAG TPA: hypothetical protein VK663_15435 [Burkholderiales bacterium]|nr:hypothetical protein [Burkholderiales bacterium]
MNFDVSQIGSLLLAILVVFLVYRRFRRSFGQQPLRPVRMRVRTVLLLIIGGLLLPTALRSSAFLAALLGGLGAGIALAVWGAARTRFLRDANQLYYVPHTYTGIAVSLLFLGRLVYRLIQAYGDAHAGGGGLDPSSQPFGAAGMLRSPLTLSLFYILVGYYVCYYSIVLWKAKRVTAEEIGPVAPAPG